MKSLSKASYPFSKELGFVCFVQQGCFRDLLSQYIPRLSDEDEGIPHLQSLNHSFTLDFICAFEYEEDANAFFKALEFRLEKYGLALAADKTRIIRFSRGQGPRGARFDFLGFEFRWDKDRAGKPHVVRRTSRKKLRNSIANFTKWCRQNRNLRLNLLFPQLNRKLRGYYNYYGVKGNADGIQEFHSRAMKILLKWLNRRSQRRSFNWQGFKDLLDHFNVPRPRITDKPRVRTSKGVWQRENMLPDVSRV